ncbi:hypothetical protein CPT_Shelanagig_049 [Salmonella phage Shelanagig]|uniref:Uncharacterized protein n=1 Tax=Salmonella phage Shelanagig TaxID=2580409 RepID=A0A5B9N415_9CAUD|nr:hypothetical protein QA044_gp49 [Salmonella phage Shelanagig]QEG07388.1 hypothetical protein CPT_Shelanagig_049 [Salmonella phage Shelanagig]
MITKQQATYLMKLVHDIDDASADMAYTIRVDDEEYEAAAMRWDACYKELMTFIASITETNE